MSQVYLHDGDATFVKHFNKVCFTESGDRFTFGFKPSRGKQFVTLLLGEIDAKETDCDIEGMLNRLGFYRREQP